MVNPKSFLLRIVCCFTGLMLLAGCSENKKITSTPGPLFPQPKSVPLNLDEGYAVNQLTGDSISPLLRKIDDTLFTGVPIKLNPTTIDLGEFDRKLLSSSNSKNSIKEFASLSPVVKTYIDSLHFDIKKIGQGGFFTNSFGKKVVTGSELSLIEYQIDLKREKLKDVFYPSKGESNYRNLLHYSVQEGLPSSYILDVEGDLDGNLWFATRGAGFCIYNGHSIEEIGVNNGLDVDFIRKIKHGIDGTIWLASYKGLFMMKGKDLFRFNTINGFISDKINDVLIGSDGTVWIATNDAGVGKFKDNKWTFFTSKEGLAANRIMTLEESSTGSVFCGSIGGGITEIGDGQMKNYGLNSGLMSNDISVLKFDEEGNLFVGYWRTGFSIVKDERIKNFAFNDVLGNSVLSMLSTWNSMLIGTSEAGLLEYNKKKGLTLVPLSDNIADINSIYKDESDNVWLGTYGDGIYKLPRDYYSFFTESNGLSERICYSIIESNDKRIWIATYGKGIDIIDENETANINSNNGICSDFIIDLFQDSKGRIWASSYTNGISIIEKDSVTNLSVADGMSDNEIWSIVEDSYGSIWLSTGSSGVMRINGSEIEIFNAESGFVDTEIYSMVEDPNDHSMWFGSKGYGIANIKDGKVIFYTEKEGLSNNLIYSLYFDSYDNLWIGTKGSGAMKLKDSTFVFFNEKSGLSDNLVFSFQENQNKNLWISTENGLTEITDIESNKFRTYDHFDGLIASDFYINSSLFSSDSVLWWASGKGIVKLNSEWKKENRTIQKVFINNIDINGQFIFNLRKRDSLSILVNLPEEKNYSYNNNHLTFHYSAIDWSAPHKIQYSYVMEGLDTEWSKPTKESSADYRNLPYGTFTFKVRAIGESQEWSESFDYTFTILPPWYHTWWARTLYVLGGLLLVYALIKWRTSKLKQRQEELEIEVQNATQEIIEQKQEVEKQKEHIEEVHKEITDSINYAERIQKSFLATEDLLNKNLNEYFVFFQPKDVVSGDFYWADELSNGQFAMVNADSTGHGVPGAIMSILNISSIEEAVKEGATAPHDIFNRTRKFIIDRLSKDGSKEGGKDGMDASIICFDFEKNVFHYTAAQNPIWIVRDGELIDIKPEKMPMGKHDHDHILFVGGSFDLVKGDVIYTLTDGFQDQFGGPKNKKFKIKPFKRLLVENASLPMNKQKHLLKEAFENWRGEEEQVDDVCVIGIKVS